MYHLIANSGLQFITSEVEFNPSEPLIMGNGRVLKYAFVETLDFITGKKTFDMLCYSSEINKYIPVDELNKKENANAIIRRNNGREELDEAGMYLFNTPINPTFFTTYDETDQGFYSINSLVSYRVNSPNDSRVKVSAFELLLDKWLPMPMFRREVDGITSSAPMAWCRMKIQHIGSGAQKGKERYRIIWVFDTQTGCDEWNVLRPFISEEDNGACEFSLCNKADLLLDFMSTGEEFHAFSDYIASLFSINLERDDSRKYKAYYIYFLNFIRLCGAAPKVTLHDNSPKKIDVDLVLDIGNSRTCGVLFEEGQFTKGAMLELHDLSNPWMYYENKTFDMRVVFRSADFGNDIVLDEEMFQWRSFVRLGEEARRLIYRSLEDDGISEKTTNYSSPKRYMWDKKPYQGQWQNLITTSDPTNVSFKAEVSVAGLSKLFSDDGTFSPDNLSNESSLLDLDDRTHHYSRSSLMTFAFVEIFQHALAQVNSVKYRGKWGNVDIRRVIRNVIITCPTAMPLSEQIFLRQSAKDAYTALTKCDETLEMATITPSPDALKVIDPYAPISEKAWKYDEASCCQLVYLCAEIVQRYGGEVSKFFELKGHVRPELAEDGYTDKALTIGSIDIGAGTTDIMICSYQCYKEGATSISPTPLFWDSFYLAGDDILRNLVQGIVIEGKELGITNIGSISSALTARIAEMTDDQLQCLPCLDNIVYHDKVADICMTYDEESKRTKKIAFASNLIHDFFGTDSSMMSFRDRRCRNDFNSQISVPIAQKMMELLRTHRPSKLYTFDELFPTIKPAAYLLNHFEHHFGFRFEDLSWRYNPDDVENIVKATMEPLLKQLALVLYSQHCDIIVLAGRPTSLDAITELFIKYVPTSPDRLIRLNDYCVGSWFPTADGQGYFYDQKSIVAVGGMVGFTASTATKSGLKGLVIDFDKMIKKMASTANYIGEYNSDRRQVGKTLLSPTTANATISVSVFPAFIGCRQLDSPTYQARPLYAIYNYGKASTVEIRLSRSFIDNKEKLDIEEANDKDYNNCKQDLELIEQSLADDGKHWLDKGEFKLTIK